MFRRFFDREVPVTCPNCGKERIRTQFSCLEVRYGCGACGTVFPLSELARLLDDETFARLAETVDDRFSDRV